MSNAEIAAELVLGLETVKTHVRSVLAKLGVRDRVQAVITAYESGFIHWRSLGFLELSGTVSECPWACLPATPGASLTGWCAAGVVRGAGGWKICP